MESKTAIDLQLYRAVYWTNNNSQTPTVLSLDPAGRHGVPLELTSYQL